MTPPSWRQQGPGCPGDTTLCCPPLGLEGQQELRSIGTFAPWSDPFPGTCQGGTQLCPVVGSGSPLAPQNRASPLPLSLGQEEGHGLLPPLLGSPTAGSVRDLCMAPAPLPRQRPFPPARSALSPMFLCVVLICFRAQTPEGRHLTPEFPCKARDGGTCCANAAGGAMPKPAAFDGYLVAPVEVAVAELAPAEQHQARGFNPSGKKDFSRGS